MSEQMIKVQLPDGSVREVSRGTTPYDIAMSISPRLAAAVVVARIRPLTTAAAGTAAEDEASEASMYGAATGGERLVDLTAPLTEDVALELLKETDEAALKVVRHSAAHVMATAILELFPETKLGHGPATDNGFFMTCIATCLLPRMILLRLRSAWVRWSRGMRSLCAWKSLVTRD